MPWHAGYSRDEQASLLAATHQGPELFLALHVLREALNATTGLWATDDLTLCPLLLDTCSFKLVLRGFFLAGALRRQRSVA